jgi:hypothetical protein
VHNFNKQEQITRSSLQNLKAAIAQCEVSLSGLDGEGEKYRNRLAKLKEDARFLSPSSDPTMLAFEGEILTAVEQITRVAQSQDAPRVKSEILSIFARCEATMALRRQTRQGAQA